MPEQIGTEQQRECWVTWRKRHPKADAAEAFAEGWNEAMVWVALNPGRSVLVTSLVRLGLEEAESDLLDR